MQINRIKELNMFQNMIQFCWYMPFTDANQYIFDHLLFVYIIQLKTKCPEWEHFNQKDFAAENVQQI